MPTMQSRLASEAASRSLQFPSSILPPGLGHHLPVQHRASLKRKRSMFRRPILPGSPIEKAVLGQPEDDYDDDLDAEGEDDVEYWQEMLAMDPSVVLPAGLAIAPNELCTLNVDPAPPPTAPSHTGRNANSSTLAREAKSSAQLPPSKRPRSSFAQSPPGKAQLPFQEVTGVDGVLLNSDSGGNFDGNTAQGETALKWERQMDRLLLRAVVNTSWKSPIPWKKVVPKVKGQRKSLMSRTVKSRWEQLQKALIVDTPLKRPSASTAMVALEDEIALVIISTFLDPVSWEAVKGQFGQEAAETIYQPSKSDLQERYLLWKDDKSYLGSLMRGESINVDAEAAVIKDTTSKKIGKKDPITAAVVTEVKSDAPRKATRAHAKAPLIRPPKERLPVLKSEDLEDVKPSIIRASKRQWDSKEHDQLVESVLKHATVDWNKVHSEMATSSCGVNRTATAIKKRWMDIRHKITYK